jgi:hypothetical protein
MNESEPKDFIDDLLPNEVRHLDDNGFTARVMAALPPARRRRWLRPTLFLGPVLAAAWLAWRWFPWDDLNLSFEGSRFTVPISTALLLFSLLCALSWGAIGAMLGDE